MRTCAALWIAVWLLAPHAYAGEEDGEVRPRLVAQAGHTRGIAAVACSPDGRLVLTGGDKAARLWDASSGKELRTFAAQHGVITAVAFSPDGTYALTCETGAARLWDVVTGAEVRVFEGNPEYAFRGASFRADGRQLATAGPNRLVGIWDVETGAPVRRLDGHERRVRAVAFSPDGRWVASAGADRTARIWDAETGREVSRWKGHAGVIESIAFSPDGSRVATASRDGTAVVWLRETGAEEQRLAGHAGWVCDVGFSADGRRLVTASRDGTARLWDARDGRLLHELVGHRDAVHAACFAADDRHVLTGSEDRLALLFDAATGQAVRRYAGRAVRVTRSCLSPDGRWIAAAGRDGRVRLWDTRTGTPVRAFSGHEGAVYSVCFSPDGTRLLTAGLDRTARLWEARTGREEQRFQGHRHAVWSANFSPDGRWVVTGSRDKTARLWDAATGAEIRRFEGHEMLVWPACFSPDGTRVLTGSLDGTARLWDPETGRELRRLLSPRVELVASVGFSPDGARVVTARGRTIYIGSASSAAEELRLEGHTGAVRAVSFSADGSRLLSAGSDRTARVWDAKTGEELLRLEGHSDEIFSASFSPDGRHILTSGDATVRLWDARDGSEICGLVNFDLGPWAVVSPDGRFDTNWADELRGLHWVMPDDPLMPLDVEVFARDYYEPRLLPRLLAGAAFVPVRPLQDLERVQPMVRITGVEADPERADAVSVTVEIEGRRRAYGGRKHDSGACDVRLFRDGCLVRYTEGTLALDPKTHRALRTFSGVALPQAARHVSFSAYAFNADGVKSRTDRKTYDRGPVPTACLRERTAYIVAVGIDAFDDPRWNLRYAVADAKALCAQLTDRIRRSGHYDRVVPVLLTSAVETGGSARRVELESVFRRLAGRPVAPLPGAPAGVEDLQAAGPDDLLIVTVSTHGYTDADGRFHLVPSDVGPGEPDAFWLTSCVSAETLSRWLRDVDAGDMVMIVDACHAAASVEAEGFKPGPMGSRGLGQIAYDKRMQILAASQAADVALESSRVRHGLLTYALVQDGLASGRADCDPTDGRLTLTEWLRYGERRVPSLAEEILRGTVGATDARGPLLGPRRSRRTRPVAQQPTLFDFAERRAVILLPK